MIKRKRVGQAIASIVLLWALMLPTAIQFSHIFKGHEHVDCKGQSTHIHEDVPDCQTCHFHLASFNYEIADYPELLDPALPISPENYFSCPLFHSFKVTNTQLRAPPHFLS